MTDTITLPRATVQQALEKLDAIHTSHFFNWNCEKEITALRSALEQPQQEPVAWMYQGIRHDDTPHPRRSLIWHPSYMDAMSASKGAKAIPLYTAPVQPQQEPVGEVHWAANIPGTILEVALYDVTLPVGTKLYAAPPRREWVGAGSDETLWEMWVESPSDVLRFARAIETKLKERNA